MTKVRQRDAAKYQGSLDLSRNSPRLVYSAGTKKGKIYVGPFIDETDALRAMKLIDPAAVKYPASREPLKFAQAVDLVLTKLRSTTDYESRPSRSGYDPTDLPRDATVLEFVSSFVEFRKTSRFEMYKKPYTAGSYESRINDLGLIDRAEIPRSASIAGLSVRELTRVQVTTYLDIYADEVSPHMARRMYNLLSPALRWGVGQGKLVENVMEGVRAPDRPDVKVARLYDANGLRLDRPYNCFTYSEAVSIIRQATEEDKSLGLLYELVFALARFGEAAAITRHRLQRSGDVAICEIRGGVDRHARKTDGKDNGGADPKDRDLIISGGLYDRLMNWYGSTEFHKRAGPTRSGGYLLLTSRGIPWSSGTWNGDRLARYMLNAGISKEEATDRRLSANSLRHSGISRAVDAGSFSSSMIASMAGNSEREIRDTYYAPDSDGQRAIANALDVISYGRP